MDINRRSFLIGSGKAAVAGWILSTVPAVLEAEIEEFGLMFDYVNKEIRISKNHPRMSVQEIYRQCVDLFDSPEYITDSIPMMRATPQIFTMENDWIITEPSFERIYGGGITQIVEGRKEIYNSFITIGSGAGDPVWIEGEQGSIGMTDHILKTDREDIVTAHNEFGETFNLAVGAPGEYVIPMVGRIENPYE